MTATAAARSRGIALYPAVIVAVLILHVWATSGVSPFGAVRAMVAAALIALVVVAICSALMPDRHLAGVAALIVILGLAVGGREPLVAVALIAAMGLVLWAGSRRLSVDWEWIGRQARRATTVLVLAVLIEIIQLGRVQDAAFAFQYERGPAGLTGSLPAASPGAPDVYVILLDGYPRHDVLADTFGIDNSAFIDGLARRGFDVSSRSHSNYLSTIPSLISFLNFRQLADVPPLAGQMGGENDRIGSAVHHAIAEAAVIPAFRSRGYETIAIGSGFEDTALRSVDRFLDAGYLNDFEVTLARPTVLASLALAVNPDAFSSGQRGRIEWEFTQLEVLSREAHAAPRFVYAHVPSPHRPWVVDADGRPIPATDLETWYFGPNHLPDVSRAAITERLGGQVRYVGQRALRAIDAILAGSNGSAVILVVSDHGASGDLATANSELVLRNLFAAYTPAHRGLFPQDTTLVNVFPTILTAYLDADEPRAAETLHIAGAGGYFDPDEVQP